MVAVGLASRPPVLVPLAVERSGGFAAVRVRPYLRDQGRRLPALVVDREGRPLAFPFDRRRTDGSVYQ